ARVYPWLCALLRDLAQARCAADHGRPRCRTGPNKKIQRAPPLSRHPRGVLDFVMLQLSKVDWRKGLVAVGAIVALVVVVSIFLIWRHYRTTDPLKGLKPGIYQSTQHISGDTLPLPPPKR